MSFFASLTGGGKSVAARLLEKLAAPQLRLEDRREALGSFKELAESEALRLIEKGGIGVLCNLVGNDDVQLVRDALETLVSLCDPSKDVKRAQLAATHNATVLLAVNGRVGSLLAVLELRDVYVRVFSLQLLGRLLAVAPDAAQAAVFASPDSVGNVLLMMDDKRDIVRNEVLSLVGVLARRGSANLHNMLAFSGAYEQLLGFIDEQARRRCTSMPSFSHVPALSFLLPPRCPCRPCARRRRLPTRTAGSPAWRASASRWSGSCWRRCRCEARHIASVKRAAWVPRPPCVHMVALAGLCGAPPLRIHTPAAATHATLRSPLFLPQSRRLFVDGGHAQRLPTLLSLPLPYAAVQECE